MAQLQLLSGDRQKGESNKAIAACNDWLRLGYGRSLPALLSKYIETHQSKSPTTSLNTLRDWSMKFDWQKRAVDYDAILEAEKERERKAVFAQGLALDYERVNKLFRLAGMLEEEIYTRDPDGKLSRVWVPDVKSIGSGENAERVDIERFNGPLLEQFRSTLDDIAKEVGGRIKRQHVELDFTKMTDEELQRIAESGG